MSYYKILGLNEEPFSTSPDPAFFYESVEHKECLLRLEIAIKLKRGLSVILGDVGTGKTTLARKLYSVFADRSRYEFNMILEPVGETELDFLVSLGDAFGIIPEVKTVSGYKKALEQHLFQKGVDEDKTIILLVDESQKLSIEAIEVLRILLNYETNKFKLLQLVLLAQMELLPEIKAIKNFWERISLRYVINPLNLAETKGMIKFRLRRAGYKQKFPLFHDGAIKTLHDYTQGCPRRITMLSHDALEALVIRNKEIVTTEIMEDLVAEDKNITFAEHSLI